MEIFGGVGGTLIAFLIVLSILVFVHEFGHYYVARWNGVAIEVFSIGFGPEAFGFTDKAGTRWKFSIIPLGGYVKMFGDANAASQPGDADQIPADQRDKAFPCKSLGQRAAIVAAGPIANFLFAIVALAGLFAIVGQPYTPPVVSQVVEDSAAEAAGLQPGDRIVGIDGQSVARFETIKRIVALNPGKTLPLTVKRETGEVALTATPKRTTVTDQVGNNHTIGRLGIRVEGIEFRRPDPATAVWSAMKETAALTTGTLKAVGQIIGGTRSAEELGGPVRIAQLSGEVAEAGLSNLISFMAVLSINLGLINLFPVPMLDGGHLLFYGIEALRGRPLGERAQEYGFRIGLALVLTLMLFVTWNDLANLQVFSFFKNLVT
jgi:regulator of sigma E protease